ncbi:hypothetical protein ASF10_07175 [Flavobacterium sp. Leaf82]|uniref:hypothetical protein n=1 Tax=Flavobacterium TaxID=237 RepID=UPI0006FE115C|nr:MULTISPECIES: hypothetical protein [Flavobacterium]KQO24946.1 hypothetical protein ASF10_07175 [Flavobacterium sp. Leaf82]OXA71251.1 hypothetical protein B0A67_13415 [Flavobacterium aquidurense]SHG69986.1 hypothetical protein SAMN05444481_106234 [Flavobacterium frigidimaris]
MKNLSYILATMLLIITGCQPKKLDEKLATTLILEKNHYPTIVDHDIFCGDPAHAYTIFKSGLVEKGFVKVLQTKKFGDTTAFVSFTPAARPYLLPTPAADKKHKIQRVKVADEEFGAIAEIRIMSSGNKAIVEYTTIRRKNVFAASIKNGLKDLLSHEVYFILADDGWQIMDKKSEIEFLSY